MKHLKQISVSDKSHKLVKRIALEKRERNEPVMERDIYAEAVDIGVAIISERELPKR